MDSTIIKNQIVYRYGLDIFHSLSDFKVLVSDVKNIAENVGMNWRICFGLCPICDTTYAFTSNPTSNSYWDALKYIKNGWQSSEESSEPTFVNLPSGFTLSSFGNNNSFFYSNIENMDNCNNNNTTLMKWISFKQNLKANITDISGGQSYPYYSTNDNASSPSYIWYAQRCSIIFYLAQKEDSNATFIIDCFNMYHRGGNSDSFYPNSFYQVATYGVRKNINDSLKDWLTDSATNGNIYGSFKNYEAGESLSSRADINSSCFLKYTYFCGNETTALSQLFFTNNFSSFYPQNRTIQAERDGQPKVTGNIKPTRNGTIATFFSKLCLGSEQEGFCVLSSYGEPGENGSVYDYLFYYSNSPWATVYTINYSSSTSGTQVMSIPSSSARKNYPYNGISRFKDFMGRYTPHLYKKFWGGRDLYDCFILEKADGTTQKMFGGSYFCIDFADEEET